MAEKTKGEVFKEKHGYSKSIKRLMQKYDCTLEEYRKVRKAAKKKIKVIQREKHTLAVAGRKSKSKK